MITARRASIIKFDKVTVSKRFIRIKTEQPEALVPRYQLFNLLFPFSIIVAHEKMTNCCYRFGTATRESRRIVACSFQKSPVVW